MVPACSLRSPAAAAATVAARRGGGRKKGGTRTSDTTLRERGLGEEGEEEAGEHVCRRRAVLRFRSTGCRTSVKTNERGAKRLRM